MLTSIDLFSGGGGLSQGLQNAGFNIIGAVENDHIAVETYKVNYPNATVFEQDIRFISGEQFLKKLNLKKGELDLLAACPPCQSFSTLTRNFNILDYRNSLINEVARLVESIMPKSIMIENVPGIVKRGRSFLNEFIVKLEYLGYIVNFDVLQVADYGVPQSRKRFVLLAGLGKEIKIPEPTHSKEGIDGKSKWRTVSDAISDLDEPITINESFEYGGPQKLNWNIVRRLSEINLKRLAYLKPGANRFDIPDNLRPKCHQGRNTGFNNVYGRMSWYSPAPTITGGCTVLSKGRFGHPEKQRAISVREAARLQTFPDNYRFKTNSIDRVSQIIGNALPCLFAERMAEACYKKLKK